MTEKEKQERIKELKGVIEDFAMAKWDVFNSSTLAEAIINAGYVRHKSCRYSEHLIEYKGQTKRLCDWAREYSLAPNTLHARLTKFGWNIEDSLTTPSKGRSHGQPKKVYQYTTNGKFVASFNSGVEAANAVGVCRLAIYRCCNGSLPTAAGFIWRWADDCGPNEKGHS